MVKHTLAVAYVIMCFAHAIQVNHQEQMRARWDLIEHLLFQLKRVGAEDDVLIASNKPIDELLEFGIERWLATADVDDRSVAFIHCLEAGFQRNSIF